MLKMIILPGQARDKHSERALRYSKREREREAHFLTGDTIQSEGGVEGRDGLCSLRWNASRSTMVDGGRMLPVSQAIWVRKAKAGGANVPARCREPLIGACVVRIALGRLSGVGCRIYIVMLFDILSMV